MPFLFGNFDVFKKKCGKKRAISVLYDGNSPPPRRQHFREKIFRYPKMPLEAGAPQSFDASYAPGVQSTTTNEFLAIPQLVLQ